MQPWIHFDVLPCVVVHVLRWCSIHYLKSSFENDKKKFPVVILIVTNHQNWSALKNYRKKGFQKDFTKTFQATLQCLKWIKWLKSNKKKINHTKQEFFYWNFMYLSSLHSFLQVLSKVVWGDRPLIHVTVVNSVYWHSHVILLLKVKLCFFNSSYQINVNLNYWMF